MSCKCPMHTSHILPLGKYIHQQALNLFSFYLLIFHDPKNNSYRYFVHDIWICVYFSFIYYCIANNLCAYFFCWFVWRKRQKNNHWSSFSYIWRSFFFFKPTFLLFNIFKKILFFILLLLDLVIYSVMPLFLC